MTTRPLMHHVSCRSFWQNIKSPRCFRQFGAPRLLAFSKTKITFEGEEISDHQWDSGKYEGQLMLNWENCVRSQGAYFEGDWGIIVLCTIFLVSSINVSVFHITWLDTIWTYLVLSYVTITMILRGLFIKSIWQMKELRFTETNIYPSLNSH